MKFLLSYAALMLLFFTVACNSESTKTDETSTNTLDNNTTTVKIEEAPKPEVKPRYPAVAPSIHTGLTMDYQEPLFINLVKPKQQKFNAEEAGQGSRSDTLYGVVNLPFKDQEMYVYQAVFNHARGNSNKWCIAIIKNGETLVDEHVVTEQSLFMLIPDKMKTGDKAINFTAKKPDGTEEAISIPYNGKGM